MKVLIINMYNYFRRGGIIYRASIIYLTKKYLKTIEVRPEWLDKRKAYIFTDRVVEDLKNEGLNTDIMLMFNNSILVGIDHYETN